MIDMQRKDRAFTLVELMVSLGLLSVILTLCFLVFSSSWRKFQSTGAVQETQTSALFPLSAISRDFSETTIDYVIYGDSTGFFAYPSRPDVSLASPSHSLTSAERPGNYPCSFLAFPSRHDEHGNHVYSSSTGQALWKSWIIYYLKQESSIRVETPDMSTQTELMIFALHRVAVAMELYPGPVADNYFYLSNLDTLVNRQIVAHNIYSLEIRGRVITDDLYSYRVSIYTRKDYRGLPNTFKATRVFSLSDPLHL